MARDAFNADLEVREQYLSLLYVKIPGEANWTLIDQGKIASPSRTAEIKEYKRIGDQNVTKKPGTISTDITLQLYVEARWDEIAHALGQPNAGAWDGSTSFTLDPTKVVDFKIVNFDGVTTAANIVATEYVNAFTPANLSPNLDADGDARVADISGSAVTYYIIPAAV